MGRDEKKGAYSREMHFKIFDALDSRFPEMRFTNEDRIAVVLNTIKGSSESSVERDVKLWRRMKRGK